MQTPKWLQAQKYFFVIFASPHTLHLSPIFFPLLSCLNDVSNKSDVPVVVPEIYIIFLFYLYNVDIILLHQP
jgi:hypothetical protein